MKVWLELKKGGKPIMVNMDHVRHISPHKDGGAELLFIHHGFLEVDESYNEVHARLKTALMGHQK